jgi:hypothetical protein
MKKALVLVLLLLFLSVTSFINFFHTEEVLQVSDTCPACHLQNSIPNLSPYDVCSCFQPALFIFEMLPTGEVVRYHQLELENPCSRAPPLV